MGQGQTVKRKRERDLSMAELGRLADKSLVKAINILAAARDARKVEITRRMIRQVLPLRVVK